MIKTKKLSDFTLEEAINLLQINLSSNRNTDPLPEFIDLDPPMKVQDLLDNLEEDEVAVIYVLPSVQEKDEGTNTYSKKRIVGRVKGNSVSLYVLNGELGNPDKFRPGQKFVLDKYSKGYTCKKTVPEWKTGATFLGKKYCYGQGILLTAGVGKGKTTAAARLASEFNKRSNSSSTRILFSERPEDSLYYDLEVDKTIDTDSSGPIETQYISLMTNIVRAIHDAHEGKDSILVIDSMTRLVMQLTALYSNSHMVSGGLGQEVVQLGANLLRLAGKYNKGTLTVIGTSLWSINNNSWKTVYTDLSASANGEVKISSLNNKRIYDISTRKKEVILYPHFTIFGVNIYY